MRQCLPIMVYSRGLALILVTLIAACGGEPDDLSSSEDRRKPSAVASRSLGLAHQNGAARAESTSLRATSRAAHIAAVQSAAGPAYDLERLADGQGVVGHNPAQGFDLAVEPGLMRVVPDSADWHFELRWTGLGRGTVIEPLAAAGEAELDGNRLTYTRGQGFQEWTLNGRLGLEHGFVLAERPPVGAEADAPVVVELTVAEGLEPRLVQDGSAVALYTDGGTMALAYSELFVTDAHGQPLPSWLASHGQRIALHVDDAAAQYPVFIDPLVAVEQDKLLASNGAAMDAFGYAVSVSGDTALVGAHGHNNGAAYVFVRTGSVWVQQQQLTANDGAAGDSFGWSVSVSGDTALIGAHGDGDIGSAYVFVRNGGVWTQQDKLLAGDPGYTDRFGCSVSLDGDTALVGAYADDDNGSNSGSAYVFVRSGGVWTQQDKLTANDGAADDRLAHGVSLSGDTALLGSENDQNGFQSGAAYVFVRNGGVWTQQDKLLPGDPSNWDLFGAAVAVSADTALIGAHWDDDNGSQSGSSYVFVRSGGLWTQQAKLTASDAAAEDHFGVSVAVVDDKALIGAQWDDDMGSDSGSAYLFVRSGGVWSQRDKLTASDGAAADHFGWAVGLAADTALIGADDDDDTANNAGSAYAFRLALELGDPCTADSECHSNHCVDGLCCDSACGGGGLDDCLVCAVAAGATTDGVCEGLNNSPCSDGQFCNGTETCSAGVCGSSTGDPCAANLGDADNDCSESCDEGTDDCTADDLDASSCDDDDACTLSDTCSSGTCTGASPVACTPLDECHGAGTCAATTGLCDDPPLANGTPCSSGTCQDGVCTPDGTGGSGGSGTGGTGAGGSGDGGAGAGGSGDGGTTTPPGDEASDEASDEGGCGCQLAGRRMPAPPWMGLSFIGLGLALARRRPA